MNQRELNLNVLCRPARQTDTADVLELTSTIWDGNDYVPSVWAEWLADPDGTLAVAESQGRVLGLAKLTRLSERDWWLEGLRVHPEYQGRGIASQLHDYLVARWLEIGSGALRLGTNAERLPVHHMCQRSGFAKIAEFTWYIAPSLPGWGQHPGGSYEASIFKPLTVQEIPQATAFALKSPSLALSSGLMDLYWRWAAPAEAYLIPEVERRRAWWWRERRGLLVVGEDEDREGAAFANIMLMACPLEELPACLEDYRRLSAGLGYSKAGWLAPLHPVLSSGLEAAGFERDWEKSLYLYEKTSPSPHSVV